jgi:hypothetical protein
MRTYVEEALIKHPAGYQYGLTPDIVGGAVSYVYRVLDGIDQQLVNGADSRLAELVELANLSAIIGNLFRTGVVKASSGKFKANLPHTYPDLLANAPDAADFEIKVALEGNKPKGHLIKPGPHVTVRYVLAGPDGTYQRGKINRGAVPWIWEVRVGALAEGHFNFSNTEGDSGKTAVINSAGMNAMSVVYLDRPRCPLVRGFGAASIQLLGDHLPQTRGNGVTDLFDNLRGSALEDERVGKAL